MAKIQTLCTSDSSTIANYLSWAQGISNALSTLGWVKASDPGGYTVNWANAVALLTNGLAVPSVKSLLAAGAWSAGTAYIGVNSSSGTNSMVTYGGLTYLCVLNTQFTNAALQVIQSTAQSLAISSVGTGNATSGTVYTGTFTGGASNGFVGFVLTITGFTGAFSGNNGTFVCSASTATTMTLSNGLGTAVTAAGTATSVATSSAVFTSGGFVSNSCQIFVGQQMAIAGMSTSSGANNVTFTATCSGQSYIGFTNASGVSETHAGSVTAASAPASSLNQSSGTSAGFWIPYNYEVWVSNGPQSVASPIYLKLVYGETAATGGAVGMPYLVYAVGTSTNNTGMIIGNYYNPGSQTYSEYNSAALGLAGFAASLFECDFAGDADSFRMIMWRTHSNANCPFALVIERARDLAGNTLPTYWTALTSGFNNTAQQSVFQFGSGPSAGYTTASWVSLPLAGSNGTLNTGSCNGQIPAMPVFPIVGFVGNPILGTVLFLQNDVAEGSLVNVVMYGASCTYLCSKVSPFLQASPKGNSAIGILWQ
jgi:hypothetical protein